MCPYAKRIYLITSYFSVLKLQNYSSQCSSCAFFRKIEEKLFCFIEVINKASATNSIMSFSNTLFAIVNANLLCFILSSSANIQKITVGVQRAPLSYIKLAITPVSRGLMLKLMLMRVNAKHYKLFLRKKMIKL